MNILQYIINQPRIVKRLIVVFLDIFISIISTWTALSIRYNEIYFLNNYDLDLFILRDLQIFSLSIIIFIPIFYFFGLYNAIFRYAGISNLNKTAISLILYSLIYIIIFLIIDFWLLSTLIGFIQPFIFFGFIIFIRLIAMVVFQKIIDKESISKILIYGAGHVAVNVSKSILVDNKIKIISFLDKDKSKIGNEINGIKINDISKISNIFNKHNISHVLVGISDLKYDQKKEIIKLFKDYNTRLIFYPNLINTVNNFNDSIESNSFNYNNLLDRNNIELNKNKINFKEKIVLVSGAGGSIGSELCRQIIELQPKQILLLDHSEINLYNINNDLNYLKLKHKLETKIINILSNIQNKYKLDNIFLKYKPQYVFHAAAYKHVPIVEDNIIESINNNVIGTYNIADVSNKNFVQKFILVSTDKAVRPTNIMGATKRAAEICIQIYSKLKNDKSSGTIFSIVRFGNVVGSSGSVVPLFSKQISMGGPISLTHPEVTRFLMTIPEAVSLILYSNEISKGGEVFVLDMGDSIKIIDLAKKMIKLSGKNIKDDKNPKGDIEIKIIGLRPGEKLYEEILIGSDYKKTNDNKIYIANEKSVKKEEFLEFIGKINNFIKVSDEEQCINTLLNFIKIKD